MPDPANKARVNLTVEADVLQAARALGLNLSHAAEDGLKRAIRETEAERWKRENATALMAHNARVERTGTLLMPEWAADLSGQD